MSLFIITGGHHNSALVLAQYLLAKNHQVLWYGHQKSSRGDQNDSAEYLEVTANKIKFFDLSAGRVVPSLTELLRLPLGLLQAYQLLKTHRPQAVISFGGYLGATTAIAAVLQGIPIYLHEQTVVAGKANRFLAHFARRIYLTWESSRSFFPAQKTVVTGLPLRASILTSAPKKFFTRRKPTLLIMGGKQGSFAVNQFVFKNIQPLLAQFNLLHQTGTNSTTQDYERALALQNSLGSLADCYLPVGYLTETQIGTYLSSADYYLGRSGAHITYELLLLGRRSILVPLDSTHQAEQYKNAEQLVRAGLGVIVPQASLSLELLTRAIAKLNRLKKLPPPLATDATRQIYHDLIHTL